MTFTEFTESLRLAPTAWVDMSQEQKDTFNQAFPPGVYFGDVQRAWVGEWWLACDQTNIDLINAALATKNTQVWPLDILGSLFIGSDLLTDSQNPGQTYNDAFEIIKTLVLTEFVGGPPILEV